MLEKMLEVHCFFSVARSGDVFAVFEAYSNEGGPLWDCREELKKWKTQDVVSVASLQIAGFLGVYSHLSDLYPVTLRLVLSSSCPATHSHLFYEMMQYTC